MPVGPKSIDGTGEISSLESVARFPALRSDTAAGLLDVVDTDGDRELWLNVYSNHRPNIRWVNIRVQKL
jgi:hypothetical protein